MVFINIHWHICIASICWGKPEENHELLRLYSQLLGSIQTPFNLQSRYFLWNSDVVFFSRLLCNRMDLFCLLNLFYTKLASCLYVTIQPSPYKRTVKKKGTLLKS